MRGNDSTDQGDESIVSDTSAARACAAAPDNEAMPLRIGQRECRLVCVDHIVPIHLDGGRSAHPRLIYAAGEVVHFDLDGHRWAIVPEQPAHAVNGDAPADVHALLTNRELQIVQLICLGCLTKQVADRLHLSEFTVRSYLKTVYCKLGVRSRGAMVFRYAQAVSRLPPGDDDAHALSPTAPGSLPSDAQALRR
jgi:DNA-binding CsgD family transcriptional regulator